MSHSSLPTAGAIQRKDHVVKPVVRLLHSTLTAATLAAAAVPCAAHDGHGLQGVHGHASDTWGFLLVATLVALAVWTGRKWEGAP
jgi:hypothetical protein